MPDLTDSREAVLKTRIFGGFDKQDVLLYIDRLRQEHAAEKDALEAQLQSSAGQCGELQEQVAAYSEKLSDMEKQLEERNARSRDLTGQISILKSQLLNCKKAQDESARSLERQEELNRQLVGRLQETEEKARNYAELSDRVGEILLSAHREADTVVGEARQQARDIRNRVSSDGRRMSDELGDLRAELGEIREQMEALSARLSVRTEAVNRLLEAIDTAGPLPERTPVSLQDGEIPAPDGETSAAAPAAVSKTAQRVFEAADAVQADAPETAQP